MRQDPETLYFASAAERCREICQEIVDEIQMSPLTPVGATGRLKTGYRVRLAGDGAEIYTDTPYWRYVEYGTSKMRAQPHVRPAIEVVRHLNTGRGAHGSDWSPERRPGE